jgi:hypothetical protein
MPANEQSEILERMRDLHRNHGGDAAVTSVYNAGESRLFVYPRCLDMIEHATSVFVRSFMR